MTARLAALIAAPLLIAAAPPAPVAPAPVAPAPVAPAPVALAPRPGSPLEQAARTLSREDLVEARKSGEEPLILVGSAKLNATDRPALFVQIQSPRECGSAGCNTSVFFWRAGTWSRILDGVGGKLSVAPTRTRGMSDLLTEKARYVWDGKAYQDSRPAPAVDLRPRR